jgi:hypothetical protein
MKRKRKKRRLEMFKKKEKHNLTKAIKKWTAQINDILKPRWLK